jgi:high-affinity Fe2+/Pb2+ permease
MANKKLFIGIAAAAAALAAVGIVLSRQRYSKRKYEDQVDEAKQHFKSKLNELQRKAQKQYKNSPDEAKDAIANATARAGRS